MRFMTLLTVLFSMALSVASAALPEAVTSVAQPAPQLSSSPQQSPNPKAASGLNPNATCGRYAWYTSIGLVEGDLAATRTCRALDNVAAKINATCTLCFFYPTKDCSGHETMILSYLNGWNWTTGPVWSFYCII